MTTAETPAIAHPPRVTAVHGVVFVRRRDGRGSRAIGVGDEVPADELDATDLGREVDVGRLSYLTLAERTHD